MLIDKLKNYKIYLVSKSPRRHELLTGMDISFEFINTAVEEYHPAGYSPVEVAEFLSQLKVSPINMEEYPDNSIFIGCDTIVVLDNMIIEKPKNLDDAMRMLRLLSGKEHTVISGLTVATLQKRITSNRKSKVRLKSFSEEELTYYVNKYQPLDKAGAYGIQEWIGYIGIDYIEGSFYNVMGLPTRFLWETLDQITE